MPRLEPPDERCHRSFLAAMAEFRAEGRGAAADNSSIGADLRERWGEWDSAAGFGEYPVPPVAVL